MASYVVTRKSDGAEVYRYQSDAAVEWLGMEFGICDHAVLPDDPVAVAPPTKYDGRRLLNKLEFRALFPEAAIKGIDRFEVQFESAPFLTDAQKDDIRTSFKNYNAADGVDLDDPRWIPGLGLYVALGILTPAEVEEILRG